MPRPKDEQNTETLRSRILDAAERLFAERGYDAAGIADIARQADVTRSLIYYYFENKEALRVGLYERFKREALALKDRIAGEALQSYRSAGGAGLTRYLEDFSFPFLERHRDAIKVGLAEEMRESSEGPLFEFLKINLQAALGYYDRAGLDLRGSKDLAPYSFFMVAFPIIAYVVLGEEWCAHSGTPRDELRRMMSRWTGEAFERLIRGPGGDNPAAVAGEGPANPR